MRDSAAKVMPAKFKSADEQDNGKPGGQRTGSNRNSRSMLNFINIIIFC